MVKRYLLFAFDNYYPQGGWHDFVGSYDTENEAVNVMRTNSLDYWHVVDLTTGHICLIGSSQ